MSSTGGAAQDTTLTGQRLAGRFLIERKLGRGGMSVVRRAVDESTGHVVALKRLVCDPSRLARYEAMFEREYRTLASLDHPRIIQVHHYGRDADGPFYTMELLDGSDMRELAPLPWRDACRYLRDVASSLALLHARRLLHRDVSPRNVRVVGDGHCKLFDFGGLATFGVADEVVGTPPCIPPEALHGLPLDQRADLYSLGALAYYLLTGSFPYRARRVADLLAAWTVPPPSPSAKRPPGIADDDIPDGLDRLVMSLLSHDAMARPSSAAEVIVRLERIAGLEAEPLPDTTASYLWGARLVGRTAEMASLEQALGAAHRHQGSAVLIEGAEGSGRSRLVGELVLHAQLSDALVLQVDGALHEGPYGLARAMALQLLTNAPELARKTAKSAAPVLAHLSPEVAERLGAEPAPLPSRARGDRTFGEWRKRMQSALRSWLTAVSRRQTLVLAVDNLDRADEPSAALLARLAHEAMGRALLVVAATARRRESASAGAVAALRSASTPIELSALTEAETQALTASLFGGVTNTTRLGTWLYARTGGNPRACHALAEHLVHERVVRYVEGSWVIPNSFSASILPDSVEQVSRARLSGLTAEAMRLLEALSVHRGPLPLERCLALARTDGQGEVFQALEELATEGLLVGSGDRFHFAEEALRERVAATLAPERRTRLHRALGELLVGQAGDDATTRLQAGFHLLAGGDEERGAELLADTGLRLMYDVDGLSTVAPALEAALAVYRRRGASTYKRVRILGPLAIGGYHTDRRLAEEYGDEAMEVVGAVCGMPLARRLGPWLGRRLGLQVALSVAAVRYLVAGRGGLRGFVETVRMFVVSAASLAGAATICLDAPRTRRYAEAIAPLVALGEDHVATVCHRFIGHLAELVEDDRAAAAEGMRDIIERVRSHRVAHLGGSAEKLLLGGALYALGALEGFCDGPAALHRADELDALGMRLYDMVADQVRTNYFASRGDMAQAEVYRARVELHAIDGGSAWQAEVWAPSSMLNAYLNTRDVMGAKRVCEQLDELAERIPSLSLFARLARGAYMLLSGELQNAVDILEDVLERDGRFVGRTAACSALARAYNGLGRHDRALALTDATLAALGEADRRFTAFNVRLQVQHARALAGVGRTAQALSLLDALIEEHGPEQGPVTMGMLHEYRGRIALAVGDRASADQHFAHMRHHYRCTASPILAAVAQRVTAELSEAPPAPSSPPSSGPSAPPPAQCQLAMELRGCGDHGARAQKALRILVAQTRTSRGYLFSCGGEPLELLARADGPRPSDELVRWAEAELALLDVSSASDLETRTATQGSLRGPRRILCPLVMRHGRRARRVAVAVLEADARVWVPPRQDLLEAIAHELARTEGPEPA